MLRLSTTNATAYRLFGAEASYRILAGIGYDCIDYGLPCALYEYGKGLFSLPPAEFEAFFEKDAALARRYELPAGQVHAPFPTWPESGDAAEREYMTQALERSILAAAIMGSPYLVLHCAMPMGWAEDTDLARTRRVNYQLFERLLPVAERYGVTLALENMPLREIPSCLPEQLIDYIDMMASDRLVACFDTGHAHLSGLDCADYIRRLGHRLRVLHLHDNEYGRIYRAQSELDQHEAPGIGNIAWAAVFAALREIGYSGSLSLESDSFYKHFPIELYRITEQFQHDVLAGMAKLYLEN